MSEVHYQSARELIRALRERSLRSSDLLEHLIARIERRDPAVNAVVARDFEHAREQARAADEALDRGEADRPLLGLPLTVKDALETEGLVTASGAPELARHLPTRNADAVQRLVNAGAIVIGKTNLPLYAGDCQSFNEVYGVTSNPWDSGRTPGGSSGGSAAALASGFTPLEIGSDIGGSIRIPAHFCGVFGHKPTWGIVSLRGHIPGPPGQRAPTDLAVVGPLARCAEDLRLALDVIAGPPLDEAPAGWQLDLPAPRTRRLQDLRVAAWLDDPFSPVDAEYRGLLEACADALERAGARVDRKARPSLDFAASFETYAMLLHPVIASGFPEPLIDALAAASASLSPGDRSHRALQIRGVISSHREWIARDEMRHRLSDVWAGFFRDFDVLLLPVHPTPAFPHDHQPDLLARTIRVNDMERPYLDFLHWVHLATVAGLPATVAPIGRTEAGLPVGVQLVAGRFRDHTSIEAAGLVAELSGGFSPPPGY